MGGQRHAVREHGTAADTDGLLRTTGDQRDSQGSIYALIALGYSMVYGVLTMINFAHGDLFMVGAFACLLIASFFPLPFIVILILVMLATASWARCSSDWPTVRCGMLRACRPSSRRWAAVW